MTDDKDYLPWVAAASIVVAAVVMGVKYVAYLKTGSAALYSDALESIVNLVTAAATFIAIRISSRPADRRHQFGHHKAEYFSAVLEGALIIVAAILILSEAWDALQRPRTLTDMGAGLAISGVASAINAGWSVCLTAFARRLRSPALAADGKVFFSLRLDTLRAVQHHDGTIHRHERAVRVFTEILVARGVEKIDARTLIVELQHGRGDRDSPRLLQLHPVRLVLTLA